MEKKKFHIELGEPVVVSAGYITEDDVPCKWGPLQFPRLFRTAKGHIQCEWNMCDDDIIGGNTIAGARNAVSEDGGKTWRAVTPEDKVVGYCMMENGKWFNGFGGKAGYPATGITDGVTPAAENEQAKVYFASDCPNADVSISCLEADPVTGAVNSFPATLNWPYLPIAAQVRKVTPPDLIHPTARVFSLSNQAGQLLLDDGLYNCVYERGFNSVTGEANKYSSCFNIYIFKSTDNARTWNFVSQILMDEEHYNVRNIPGFEGFCEPKMEKMPDGSVVMLIRTGGVHPSYITRSTDNCKTWSNPVIFDDFGVLPQITALKCGVTIATYGRPRLRVRATGDPSGLEWEAPIEIPMSLPFEKDPSPHHTRTSCFYTRLLALDDTTALMTYTDFHYPDKNGDTRKSVLVRTIKVVLD